ncbi:Uncharacterised protein [Mycobacterium tuberculosis]|uniref:Uncharacterized protein n=1 Tax=Mycobacterium tuberculosis TaxID=1773 RepID=A0A655JSP1_MYCTX|nr:Uncharacterised protein [Mycobacterium tuberculosis]COW63466.1 Uncharacterised protein [Mycobacterium tuberculosis]COX76255.1 Uncharacterised protein [Mycobacterium tuberculosis]COY46883.1 Uncharacterised protein [Mycobacterium tuberculosis]
MAVLASSATSSAVISPSAFICDAGAEPVPLIVAASAIR